MDEPLSRIPFSRDEEHTIGSMARWMRFMAIVGIVGAILILFLVLVGAGLYTGARRLADASSMWARLQAFVDATGPLVCIVGAVILLMSAVAFWQNFVLYHAGDDFGLMARTDTADLDYLSRGLDKLRLFFKIQVLVAIVTIAVAFGAVVIVMAMHHRA